MLVISRNLFLFIHLGSLFGHVLREIDISSIKDPVAEMCGLIPPRPFANIEDLNLEPDFLILCPNGNYTLKMIKIKENIHQDETIRKMKVLVAHILVRIIVEIISQAAQGKFKMPWSDSEEIDEDENNDRFGFGYKPMEKFKTLQEYEQEMEMMDKQEILNTDFFGGEKDEDEIQPHELLMENDDHPLLLTNTINDKSD